MEYNAMVASDDTEITSIRVSIGSADYYVAELLEQDECDDGLNISDIDSGKYLTVRDKTHAENIIRGLQKAIELGWVK